MKVALVTGAGRRIGKAIAEHLLLHDFQVILHANSSIADLHSFAKKTPQRSQIIAVICADLSTELGQNDFISQIKRTVTKVDLLVNNASTFSPMPYYQIGRKEFREMLAVNLEAPFFITQGLLGLLHNASSPSVINILDAMWERPSPQFSHYAVSKAGLAILTRALANELAPKIRVNAVAPGNILFPSFYSQEMRENIVKRIPHGSPGRPQDVAEAIIFLSQKASYATGEILVIDGGRSIAP